MINRLLFIVWCILCSVFVVQTVDAGTGTLFVRKLKTQPDGTRTANIISFDREAKVTPFSDEDLELFEGGQAAEIISITCPEPLPPIHVSSVLTIDVSGSMVRGKPSNLTLAIEAATAWINALSDTSECAITTFDHTGSVLTDFTSDKTRLIKKLDDLIPNGGTDFNEGLLSAASGGVSISEGGRNRRVVVFLTDGNGRVSPSKVIAAAKANNATVYCVSLGLRMPTVLKTIAEETGGLWFESVTTVDDAVMAYRRIYADATGAGGCDVVWRGVPNCTGVLEITARLADGEWHKKLAVPPTERSRISIKPSSLAFGTETGGFQRVVIRAQSKPLTISALALDRTDVFAVGDVDLPVTIGLQDSLELEVTRLVVDSNYVVGKIEFETSPCPIDPIYISAGDVHGVPKKQTLRVVHPNGGERFAINSRINLEWEGLPPSEPVSVEISTNNGYTWMPVSSAATGLNTLWKAVRVPSDSCLLRVTHIDKSTGQIEPDVVIKGNGFFQSAISPDGQLIAGSEMTGRPGSRTTRSQIRLYDAVSGDTVKDLGPGENLRFSTDGSVLLTWDHHDVRAYDVSTRELLWVNDPVGGVLTCDISDDGSRVLIAGSSNEKTQVIDGRSGEEIAIIPRSKPNIQWADLSANGEYVAVSDKDSLALVYKASTGELICQVIEPEGRVFYRVEISPTSRVFATVGSHGSATLWNLETGEMQREVSRRRYVNDNTYLAFSPDGSKLAVEANTDQTRIVAVETGEPLVSIRRKSDVGGASGAGFLSDGNTMFIDVLTKVSFFDSKTGVQIGEVRRGGGRATASVIGDKIAVINENQEIVSYTLNSPLLQQDVSDNLWAIYAPNGELKEVDFGSRQIGQFTDSLVSSIVVNKSRFDTLHVTSVSIQGSNRDDFSYAIPDEFEVPPNDSIAFDFTFHPKDKGLRQASIVMMSDAGRLSGRLLGTGLSSVLEAGSGDFDLGVFPVGQPITATIDSLIVNTGTEPVTVLSIEPVGPNAELFSVMPFDPFVVDVGAAQGIHVMFNPDFPGKISSKIEIRVKGMAEPVIATIRGAGIRQPVIQIEPLAIEDTLPIAPPPQLADPTTFRSILLPSAVVPKAGTVTTGVYDVVGLMAGYSVTDNIAILAGGVLPIPNRWFGAKGYNASVGSAWFIGAKGGYELDSSWVVGGGLNMGQSYYDQDITPALESKITFQSFWFTGGYGDDDSRLNATFGYAFKNHQTTAEGTFDADAFLYGLAYDYRVAYNWKVCVEGFFMRTMDFVPITVTARYFTERDAFEAGFSFVGIQASGKPEAEFPLVPMLSWVRRW